MRSAIIALALATVLAAGACSRGDGPAPMAEGTEGQEEGRIAFSRTTEFDGSVLTVDLSSPEGRTLKVNTLRDSVETDVYRPPIPNHSGKSWVLRNFAHDSTSLVYAVVSWDNDDPMDYLAAGWWIHQPGREYDPDTTEYVIFHRRPGDRRHGASGRDAGDRPGPLCRGGRRDLPLRVRIGLGRSGRRRGARRVPCEDGRGGGFRQRHAARLPGLRRRHRGRPRAPRVPAR